ncbi:unnamed protein product [Amoebophrya sp. A25]|nr:unnamed protein product [Amoebophrya sp. A25]|eukprot:GSA25T00019465001.1
MINAEWVVPSREAVTKSFKDKGDMDLLADRTLDFIRDNVCCPAETTCAKVVKKWNKHFLPRGKGICKGRSDPPVELEVRENWSKRILETYNKRGPSGLFAYVADACCGGHIRNTNRPSHHEMLCKDAVRDWIEYSSKKKDVSQEVATFCEENSVRSSATDKPLLPNLAPSPTTVSKYWLQDTKLTSEQIGAIKPASKELAKSCCKEREG